MEWWQWRWIIGVIMIIVGILSYAITGSLNIVGFFMAILFFIAVWGTVTELLQK